MWVLAAPNAMRPRRPEPMCSTCWSERTADGLHISHIGVVDAVASGDPDSPVTMAESLEYALAAPAPRRHRTWLYRVTVAVGALHAALHAHLPTDDKPFRLLDEIALADPHFAAHVRNLHQELLDLTYEATGRHVDEQYDR